MKALGTCCGEQQGTFPQKTDLLITRSQKYKSKQHKLKQNFISLLMISLVVLLGTVFSTASAQRANVRLELLTTSERLSNGAGSSPLSIGDKVGLRVSSDCNCYIYIFNYDAVGTLSPLNSFSDNFLQVGSAQVLPNNYERFQVQGPAGRESIFAIASVRPLSTPRLQQLVTQQIQAHTAQIQAQAGGARALLNGGGGSYGTHNNQQDGWLAANIQFDVVAAGYQSQLPAQQPSSVPTSQMPAPQAPAPQAPLPQVPATNYNTPAPAQSPISAASSNASNSSCVFSSLKLKAPSNSAGVSERCINKSFDSSFQSSFQMNDIIKYFGTELANQGFDYQATTKNEARDFKANFAYQGMIYQMQVEKSGPYYRFELLEYGQQAMNKYYN